MCWTESRQLERCFCNCCCEYAPSAVAIWGTLNNSTANTCRLQMFEHLHALQNQLNRLRLHHHVICAVIRCRTRSNGWMCRCICACVGCLKSLNLGLEICTRHIKSHRWRGKYEHRPQHSPRNSSRNLYSVSAPFSLISSISIANIALSSSKTSNLLVHSSAVAVTFLCPQTTLTTTPKLRARRTRLPQFAFEIVVLLFQCHSFLEQ